MSKSESRSHVLITGATAGIGYELAKLFAIDGHNLILIARDKEKLKEVKKHLEIYNINVDILSVDLSVDSSCEQVFAFVDKKNLTVDILINNAGVGSFGDFSSIPMKKELALIDINIRALTELTKHFLYKMVENENGTIMNVASTAAFCAGPRMATYYASKAYVLNLTEALNEEVKNKGVKVSCLCPGAVNTGFQNKAGIKKNENAKKNIMSAKKVAQIAYRDLEKGKTIIIPGFKNKILVIVNKFLPRVISRKIIFKINNG
ncbi:SDR family NAD(P)-dependent oxidoreductase [Clostridium gasigenes]|uniref:SDR family NAD(P)-dependent oxidoreductase n=1 Tax=Clostridium gasigenes TaxID=94869 RepID=UPI001C0DD664|nr:SDR family oxidoreductase [Clostridium gasigenes]MBU3109221.1 SDR family oxidoreductase [Clostridium gasigenes]